MFSGTTNGTRIHLWDCNGTGAQQWTARGDGTLLNPQSGRCLTVPGTNPADGTQLVIRDCTGSPAQTWRLPT
jgi:hypothetical protein